MLDTQCNSLMSELIDALTANTKQVLTVKETATLTGMSERTIYKYCNERRLPHYKSAGGKMTYFKRSEIEMWMCHTKVATLDEIESDAAKMLISKAVEIEMNRRKTPKNF